MKYGVMMLLACAGAAQAEAIYKWVDGNGRVIFSDQPPPVAGQAKADKLKLLGAGRSAQPQPASAPAAGNGSLEQDIKKLNDRVAEHNRKVKAENCQTARNNLAALQKAAAKPGLVSDEALNQAQGDVRAWCGQ